MGHFIQAMTYIPPNTIAVTEDGTVRFEWCRGRESNPHVLGQRILSPVVAPLPSLTKRYEPVFTRLAVVKVTFRLA